MTAASGAEITLTFDNGPEPEVTPAVLDVLRRRGLRATFFVMGRKLAEGAGHALAERAHAEGHWIGNHTFTHGTPLGEQPDEDRIAEAEIARAQDLIGGLAHPDRLFRPFGGGGRIGPHLLNGASLVYLLRHRFTCVLWNAVPGDWQDPDGWVERALAQCAGASPSVLVLHDLPTGAMRHLDRCLGLLADRGCRFPQAFPAACTPIRRGVPQMPMDAYVTRGAAGPGRAPAS
ncbi:MAG TPA: polysaccharide deacetylase family protein [Roseomonas sp.]|jgi:peptidoglycan/xylan/chitin deacetylase (PgdA/CDA1 family)